VVAEALAALADLLAVDAFLVVGVGRLTGGLGMPPSRELGW
jgi:hypothetical protein